MRAQVSNLRRELLENDEHFEKVHGIKCDFVCRHITIIDPIEAPSFTKLKAPGTLHEWTLDKLTPVEQHTGWWWRKVWAWLLHTTKKSNKE